MDKLHQEMILIDSELDKIIYSSTKCKILYNKLLNYKIKKIRELKKLNVENHIKLYLIELVQIKVKELQDLN